MNADNIFHCFHSQDLVEAQVEQGMTNSTSSSHRKYFCTLFSINSVCSRLSPFLFSLLSARLELQRFKRVSRVWKCWHKNCHTAFMVAISTIPVSPDAAFLRLVNVPNLLPQLLQDKSLQEEFWQARIPPWPPSPILLCLFIDFATILRAKRPICNLLEEVCIDEIHPADSDNINSFTFTVQHIHRHNN